MQLMASAIGFKIDENKSKGKEEIIYNIAFCYLKTVCVFTPNHMSRSQTQCVGADISFLLHRSCGQN